MIPGPGRRAEDLAAAGVSIPDLIAPGLRVLFCGINPGLRSGATGRHFARPGNRFWRVLHESGLTQRLLAPDEQAELPALGIGITNLVARTSARADELTSTELRHGAAELEARTATWAPAHVAVLGVLAYRSAFARPAATVGRQPELLAGADVWMLPNPSGLQASYPLAAMVELYHELAVAAGLAPD